MSLKKTLNEKLNLLVFKKLIGLIIVIITLIAIIIFSILNHIQNSQIQIQPQGSQLGTLKDLKIYGKDGEQKFKVYLATTPEKQKQGLMNIKSLNQEEGMLFIFPTSQPLSFWMKNTYIPLDIIFIDSNLEIIKIHQNTKPLNTTLLYNSEQPAKYALEINANLTEKLKIELGDKIDFSY